MRRLHNWLRGQPLIENAFLKAIPPEMFSGTGKSVRKLVTVHNPNGLPIWSFYEGDLSKMSAVNGKPGKGGKVTLEERDGETLFVAVNLQEAVKVCRKKGLI